MDKDFIGKDGTTRISVHLRFGFLSVREVAKSAYQYSEKLLKELIWRSFFSQIFKKYCRYDKIINKKTIKKKNK